MSIFPGLFYPGSKLSLHCGEGYHLASDIPTRHLNCNAQLHWELTNTKDIMEQEDLEDVCIANDCDPPPEIHNAQVVGGKNFRVGDIAQYTCKSGFIPKVSYY